MPDILNRRIYYDFPLEFFVSSSASSGIDKQWDAIFEKTSLKCAIPRCFQGPGKGASPEDFYALSLLNSYIATFKVFAEKPELNYEKIKETGIGLTISKQFIELMGGVIDFESEYGKGSLFYIDFPLSVDFPNEQKLEVPSDIHTVFSNSINAKKILYFEDVDINIKLVSQILSLRKNINLLSATTALEGIQLAPSETPDLILMDMLLPDMDGWTAFKELQMKKETKNIPVIALTANAMDG